MYLRSLHSSRFIKGALAAGAAFFGTLVPGFGQTVLAGWDFNSTSGFGANPTAATYVADHLTIGGLTRGSGLTTSGSAAARGWGANGWNTTSSDAAAAVTSSDFITFSITVDSGYALSLSSLSTFEYRRSGTGPTAGQLQYSLDGVNFTNIGGTLSYSSSASSGASVGAIDFSSTGDLQDLVTGTTVTFRLANYGATGSTGTFYLFDVGSDAYNAATKSGLDFAVSGTLSAVPEPSTYAAILGGLALAGVMIHRRRRAAAC